MEYEIKKDADGKVFTIHVRDKKNQEYIIAVDKDGDLFICCATAGELIIRPDQKNMITIRTI